MIAGSQLCSAIATSANMPASKVKAVLDTLGDVTRIALGDGHDVAIPGVGILKVKTAAAREARNPRTNEPVKIPERRVVKFKASAALVREL